MTTSRTSREDGHIIITGTGRAGTTFLVQWFTALGFDTGFSADDARSRTNAISNAGLEHHPRRERLPYVAKSPHFMKSIGPGLAEGRLKVKACIVPMRDIHSAAESRRDASRRAEEQGLDPQKQPGGLAFRSSGNPKQQEQLLAVHFHELMHTLARHRLPVFLLGFPEFVTGEQSLFHGLEPLLREHGVTEDEAAAATAAIADPSLVHQYGAG